MNEKIKKIGLIFSIVLICISIILTIFNLTEFFNLLNSFEIKSTSEFFNILSALSFSWILILNLFIIGYLIYFPLKHQKNIFKQLSLISISLSILFLSISLFFFSSHSYTQNIGEQIQPSIDYIIVSNLENILNSQIEIQKDKQINILITKKNEIHKLYNSNLTQNQAKLITSNLNLNLKKEDEIVLVKLLISQLHSSLKNQGLENSILPLNTIIKTIQEENKNLKELESISYSSMQEILDINQNAKLTIEIILEQENSIITIGNLNEEKVNLLWEQLNLKNTSFETKRNFINIFLSQIFIQLEQENLQTVPIPISTIGNQIPIEIKTFLNYDLFNNNISKRVVELKNIRNDCNNPNISILDELCEGLNLTIYENLILNFQNLSKNEQIETQIISENLLENIKTSKDIENLIQNQTNKYKLFATLSFIFFILSFIFYFLHFFVFKQELIKTHIPYFIFKNFTIKLGFSLPILILIFILISSGYFFSIIPNNQEEINFSKEIFLKIPIVIILIEIIKFSLILHIIFFLIFLLIYGLTYYLQIKELEKL